MAVNSNHIDHIYDAMETMAVAVSLLGNGDVGNNLQQSLSWLLGSAKKRLGNALSAVELMENEQSRKPDVLDAVIFNYEQALETFVADHDEIDGHLCEGPTYRAYRDAEIAFIDHPCTTSAEVQRKVSYVLGRQDMYEAVHNGTGEREELELFLKSLQPTN